ncbi:unnamed protein product [Psylliodes chrysocephalus]|uniref:Kinetochore protein NDC80 n=1 Tax=Psylliodes chrysocephalus TaxID=3402493 RepID=A0A9P0CXF1_9CUCU|nr:unnamed protein product [Psylliodes chrysocephala]
MQRRSNSSSHIPVRLFGPSTGSKDATARKRSNSLGRLSQQRESSAVKFKVNSVERKSNLLKTTPLTRQRSYGFSYATPSSIGSVGSRGSRVSPATGLKDKQSIQKLSTNSLWVAQQYKKVQNYISESEIFDLTVINPSNIKPPSIKGFIYLVTTLLKQIYPNPKNITHENYKEEIVNKLKKLHYPGTMTISTLKSVNTMHCWAQVIGMCGWLIDKITLKITGFNDYSILPPEELHKYLLQELSNAYFCQLCIMFNAEDPPEQLKEAEQKYKEDFMKILCVDAEEFHKNKTEFEQLEDKKARLTTYNDNALQEYQAIKAKRNKLRNDLATLERSDEDELVGLETERDHFNSVYNKLALMKNQLESRVELLNKRKRNQTYSYQEKIELLLKSENLKKEISLIKGRNEHAQNIKHKFDDTINEELLKLESKVIQWNRSLMEVCIKNPSLKKLLLKETGFYKDEFLQEMCEIAKMKQDIEIHSTRKCETLEVTLKQKIIDMQNVKKDLEILQSEINKYLLESKQFDQHKEDVDEDIKQALSDWDIQMKNILSSSESSEVNQIKQLTEENATLKIIRDKKLMELKEFSETAPAFFIELNKQVENIIKELNLITAGRRQRIEELSLKKSEDGERFILFLEDLSREDN